MRRKTLLLLVLAFLFGWAGLAQAQLWSSILTPARAVDWQANQVGVLGGIPARTTICQTIQPYNGTSDAINVALRNCPAGQTVQLAAGTFNLTTTIDFSRLYNGVGVSNVTLRGMGADQTFLVFSGAPNSGCWIGPGADICMTAAPQAGGGFFWQATPLGTAGWTSGYSQGTTTITLTSTAGLSPGMLLGLHQQQDPTIAPAQPPSGIFVSSDCTFQTSGCEGVGPVVGGGQTHPQVQWVTIQSISGNKVTFASGLHATNWSGAKNTQAWWWGDNAGGDHNGVEHLSLDHTNSGGVSGIQMMQVTNCWVKGVRDIKTQRNHIWLSFCQHCEVRDSYFFATKSATDQSYGVETDQCSDCLVENNIFQQIVAPNLTGESSGSVIAYNYHIFAYNTQCGPAFNCMLNMDSASHHAAGFGVLIEGNQSNGHSADLGHGPSNALTMFRTRYLGNDTPNTPGVPLSSYTYAVTNTIYHRYYNYIGNILGQANYHTVYECSAGPEGINCNGDTTTRVIWNLGYSGGNFDYTCGTGCAGFTAYLPDADTIGTLYRWGNYDVVTAGVRWCGGAPLSANCNGFSEVPSDQFVPASHTLPVSLYRTAKPSWFGSVPWPPIGPDVTGGNDNSGFYGDPSGHTNMIPAKRCFITVMHGPADGTGAVLTFNANNCYGSSSSGVAPAAPTNLTVR